MLNLETAEQRRIIPVALDSGGVLRHHMGHELLRLLVHVIGIDQDVADVVVEIVANGTNDQA